jgi:putative peptide maturation dehydrogenase
MTETSDPARRPSARDSQAGARDVRIRRCAVVMIEPREHIGFDLAGMFAGREAIQAATRWIALAAHLDGEIALDPCDIVTLGRVGPARWLHRGALARDVDPAAVDRLLQTGLLIGDGDDPVQMRHRERDQTVRASHWRPLAALHHVHSRWSDESHGEGTRRARERGMPDIMRTHGPPPSHLVERSAAADRIALPVKSPSDLDALFDRRVTCRNFDRDTLLQLPVFASIMHRVFGAQAVVEVMPGAFGLKKANPSGGALHPLEAYLLVRRVDGVATGLYHYHPVAHALEPIRALDQVTADRMAHLFVAGQGYFAEAPVHIVLAARFGRTHWKYRNHAKAYRAITIEVGHVAQNLYLAATEAGLGAYVTAAINEIDIERAFALESMAEGPLAVLGFGQRAAKRTTVEFDPLNTIWPDVSR